MKVQRADHAGACFGVMRALELAEKTLQTGGRVWTLGSLIHNPTVVASLQARGAVPIEDFDQAQPGDRLIIRSHGTTPRIRQDALTRGLDLVDATCPHVARAQKAAYDLGAEGMSVVIIGEKGHPEVEALAAWAREAQAQCWIVASLEDLPEDLSDPLGVVVQTTQTRATFEAIVQELRQRGLNPQVRDTICCATRERQEAAMALAAKVDAMVVVGGSNSANTQRLAELCRQAGTQTFAIESADELNPQWFADFELVGVTAGASTPEDQINSVIDRLKAF